MLYISQTYRNIFPTLLRGTSSPPFPGQFDCDVIAGFLHRHQFSHFDDSGLYDAGTASFEVDFDEFVGLRLGPQLRRGPFLQLNLG